MEAGLEDWHAAVAFIVCVCSFCGGVVPLPVSWFTGKAPQASSVCAGEDCLLQLQDEGAFVLENLDS